MLTQSSVVTATRRSHCAEPQRGHEMIPAQGCSTAEQQHIFTVRIHQGTSCLHAGGVVLILPPFRFLDTAVKAGGDGTKEEKEHHDGGINNLNKCTD